MSDNIDLKAPEVQAAIQAAVDAAVAPLVSKRDELLSEVKKLRKESTIKPEDVEKLETEIDTLKGQLTTAQKEAKTFKDAADKATKDLESESGYTQKLLVDNGLGDALLKANVNNPAHLKAVKSMLSGQVKIVVDGENRKAMVGDKELTSFVTEWAASDEGKHFVSAPGNGGGGAPGGGGNPAGKTMTRAAFDAADQATRALFSKEGGKVVD
jgi:hypothetical protein